jgi:DNA-binding transcriptional LysR family regulator
VIVNLRELSVFRAVMSSGTTVGAARALNLSQPSVSRLLSDLEARVRVTLFRREGGRLMPTHDAHLLLEEVERAFESLQVLSDYTGRLSGVATRPIRLVVSPGLAYRFAPRAVALFEATYPSIPVIIDMERTDRAAEFVASGQADLAVSLLPANHPGVRMAPLIEVPIVAAMVPGHPLASRVALAPADLACEPLILISRRYPARILIDEAFEQAGMEMKVRIESGTSAAACGSAQAGLGIALVNAFMAREFGAANLATLPFQPLIRNSFGMLVSRTEPPRATSALMDCLREAAREQAGDLALESGGAPAPGDRTSAT